MKNKNTLLLNFLAELGQLQRVKHAGLTLVGIDNPKSVAEHSLRASQIGFVLAEMEKITLNFESRVMKL